MNSRPGFHTLPHADRGKFYTSWHSENQATSERPVLPAASWEPPLSKWDDGILPHVLYDMNFPKGRITGVRESTQGTRSDSP